MSVQTTAETVINYGSEYKLPNTPLTAVKIYPDIYQKYCRRGFHGCIILELETHKCESTIVMDFDSELSHMTCVVH